MYNYFSVSHSNKNITNYKLYFYPLKHSLQLLANAQTYQRLINSNQIALIPVFDLFAQGECSILGKGEYYEKGVIRPQIDQN